MRPGEKELGRFWARWAPIHKHSTRRRWANYSCIPQEMEIKNLRWVLTWHLKETDLARILEGRNAMLVFCLPCVSPRGGDPNATSRGEQQVSSSRWAAAGEQQQVSSSKQQQGAASSRQEAGKKQASSRRAAGKLLESWRQKKCYVSIDLLRKIQKTWPYPSQHFENLFLNVVQLLC